MSAAGDLARAAAQQHVDTAAMSKAGEVGQVFTCTTIDGNGAPLTAIYTKLSEDRVQVETTYLGRTDVESASYEALAQSHEETFDYIAVLEAMESLLHAERITD